MFKKVQDEGTANTVRVIYVMHGCKDRVMFKKVQDEGTANTCYIHSKSIS